MKKTTFYTTFTIVFCISLLISISLIVQNSKKERKYVPGEQNPNVTQELQLQVNEKAPFPSFSDVTTFAGIDTKTFTGVRTSQIPEDYGSGIAFCDFDNDGDDDVFIVAEGGALNVKEKDWKESKLFENLGNGKFKQFTHFPKTKIIGMGAAFADVDNDGFQDLLLTGYNELRLYKNIKGKKFIRDEKFLTQSLKNDLPRGAVWAGVTVMDFDRDGYLDFYVTGYLQYKELTTAAKKYSTMMSVPYTLNSMAYPPLRNLLLQNNGKGKFENVGAELGVSNAKKSLSAIWYDFNADGWSDLYVANDADDNELFLNVEGKFKPAGHSSWVSDFRFAMGIAVNDYDRDGDSDLFITHWAAQENALYDSLISDKKEELISQDKFGKLGLVRYLKNNKIKYFNKDDDSSVKEVEIQYLGSTKKNSKEKTGKKYWFDFVNDKELEIFEVLNFSKGGYFLKKVGRFQSDMDKIDLVDHRFAVGEIFELKNNAVFNIKRWLKSNKLSADVFTDSSYPIKSILNSDSLKNSKKQTLRFEDVADKKGLGQLSLKYIGWGAEFVDIDNDGWNDLVVANGSTLEAFGVGQKKLIAQKPMILWNEKGQMFYDLIKKNQSVLSVPHNARGLAVSDYDNDGDMDILIMNKAEGPQLLRNDIKGGNWAKIRIRNLLNSKAKGYGFGEGTMVTAIVNGKTMGQYISNASYLSQSSKVIHFGLGEAKRIDFLKIKWTSGKTSLFENIASNKQWTIYEDTGITGDNSSIEKHQNQALSVYDTEKLKTMTAKNKIKTFWQIHRQGMSALKSEGNKDKALRLLQQALLIDPRHEDSLYYVGVIYGMKMNVEQSMKYFMKLVNVNPQSHRGHKEIGKIYASQGNYKLAEKNLNKALNINSEEIGVLLILGEISLIKNDVINAEKYLNWLCQTNPKTKGGYFLRGYLRWKDGKDKQASEMFVISKKNGLASWKPPGSTTEGEVVHKMYEEKTLLSDFWEGDYIKRGIDDFYKRVDRHVRKNK